MGLLGRTFILASIVIVSLTKSVGPAFTFPYFADHLWTLAVDCGSLVGPFLDVCGSCVGIFSLANAFVASCGDLFGLLDLTIDLASIFDICLTKIVGSGEGMWSTVDHLWSHYWTFVDHFFIDLV